MPLTIQAPPSAPISSNTSRACEMPAIFSAMAASKSAQVILREAKPMLMQKAVATSSATCEAPFSVSSPNRFTTHAMSATSITSGTHDIQIEGNFPCDIQNSARGIS